MGEGKLGVGVGVGLFIGIRILRRGWGVLRRYCI